MCGCVFRCSILIYEYTKSNSSFRGKFFRTVFEKLGEVRRPIPCHVHVMALTGTATKCAITNVCTKVGLLDPKIITKT